MTRSWILAVSALLALPACFAGAEEGPGCTNTCRYASDGDCDDGGEGADFFLCELGTDCNDCGPRSTGGSAGALLTCHDGRPGYEQCVHYTFSQVADRDRFYDACAGLTSRTRDVHNCPGGATGDGFCRHTATDRVSDTYTYNGTAAELRTRCADTGGSWM